LSFSAHNNGFMSILIHFKDGTKLRVVIAGNKTNTKDTLKKYLKEEGYNVIAEACDGFDTIKLCRQHNPDIIIMEINMPLLDGISTSKIINDEDIAGSVVFVLPNVNKHIINNIKEVGAKGCIILPIDKYNLISTIEIASYTGKELRKIKKEKQLLEQKFEDRKAIDKAKGILMLNENLTEEEAYSKIRKYSMEKRVTMREISEFIIISNKYKL